MLNTENLPILKELTQKNDFGLAQTRPTLHCPSSAIELRQYVITGDRFIEHLSQASHSL